MLQLPRQIRKHLAGPRILKTGLAVLVCELLFLAIGWEQYAAFAATSAIVAILPSIMGSKNQLKRSLIANLLAGCVALVVGLLWNHSPMALTIATMIVLWALVKLHMGEQAGVVSVTMIWMLSREASTISLYIVARVGAIAVGTLIGYLINRYVMPPNFLRRIRERLSESVQATTTYGERIAASLTHPESLTKAEMKSIMRQLRDELTVDGQWIQWQIETGTPETITTPLQKVKAGLFVYVTELARVHKIALRIGGFPPGPVADQVAEIVRAVCLSLQGVCQPILRGEEPDLQCRLNYHRSADELILLVHRLLDDRETRDLGLACHRVHIAVRHMGRRMRICREAVAAARESVPTGQGNAVF